MAYPGASLSLSHPSPKRRHPTTHTHSDPARFEKSLVVRTGSGNRAVAVNNWKRLLRAMVCHGVALDLKFILQRIRFWVAVFF